MDGERVKQKITIEQLSELSTAQKEKFHDQWFDERDLSDALRVTVDVDDIALPQMNIGQMIEYLYDNTQDFGIHYNDSGVCFYVYLSWSMDTASPDRIWMKDELCDALWEAVKHTLR
jgi:hypothetical protein